MQGKLELNKYALEEAFAHIEYELDQVARGLVVTFWNILLVNTPQWTGAMAASWNFTYGNGQPVDRHDMVQDREAPPYQKGHPIGIDIATAACAPALNNYKLGEVAYITNGVTDEHANYYAQDIEEGRQRIRAVNRPGNAVAIALGTIDARYGAGIKPAAAKQLAKVKA